MALSGELLNALRIALADPNLAEELVAAVDAATTELAGDITCTSLVSSGAVTGASISTSGNVTASGNVVALNVQTTATSITANADGTGTAIVPANTSFITVTSANADHIITTPTPTPGLMLRGSVGANGFELRCAGASEKINNVVCGATNEAAVPANHSFELHCLSATEWILKAWTNLGAEITAIVPNTR